MPVIAEHAATAAHLLAEHPELPVANLQVHGITRTGAQEVEIQVAELSDVARWAAAIGTPILVNDRRAYVHARTVFFRDNTSIRIWTHVPGRDGFQLLGNATRCELDPQQVLDEAMPA